jgi:heptaprenyl diphosphate synthase
MLTAATSSIYYQDLLRVKELVKKYTNHPMLGEQVVGKPYSSIRQHMVFFLLRHAGVPEELAKMGLVAISLVEKGMGLHDEVDTLNGNQRDEPLKVLAGDYFSSQYYRLLAEANQSSWISILSGAICQINLLKMNARYLEGERPFTLEKYCNFELSKRSAIFDALVEEYWRDQQDVWKAMARQLLWLEWLHDEWQQLKWSTDIQEGLIYYYLLEKSSLEEKKHLVLRDTDSRSKRKVMLFKYQCHSWLRQELEAGLREADAIINRFSLPEVQKEWSSLTYYFAEELAKYTAAGEES